MSAPEEYRKGPSRLDVAARLPNGTWMRLANGARLTDVQVADWSRMVPMSDPTYALDALVDLASGYVDNPGSFTMIELVRAIEQGAFERGRAQADRKHELKKELEQDSWEKRIAPDVQRTSLLMEFEEAGSEGLTMREAAARAGLLDRVVNYSSRFGSDLVKAGQIVDVLARRNGSKVMVITPLGRKELARIRGTS